MAAAGRKARRQAAGDEGIRGAAGRRPHERRGRAQAGDACRARRRRRADDLALDRVVALDPFDAAAHTRLGRLALKQRDADVATREFRAALQAGAPDKAAAHCDLGEGYLLANRPADAKKEALAALEIAPGFERAQELLLNAIERKS